MVRETIGALNFAPSAVFDMKKWENYNRGTIHGHFWLISVISGNLRYFVVTYGIKQKQSHQYLNPVQRNGPM